MSLFIEHKYIRKVDGEYCVYSEQTGRSFGCYKTKPEAEARLAQMHKFKGDAMEPYVKEVGKVFVREVKGGAGSGNFGHAGRPGMIGGSEQGGLTAESRGPGGGIIDKAEKLSARADRASSSASTPKEHLEAAKIHREAAKANQEAARVHRGEGAAEFPDEGYSADHYDKIAERHETSARLSEARAEQKPLSERQKREAESFFGKQ